MIAIVIICELVQVSWYSRLSQFIIKTKHRVSMKVYYFSLDVAWAGPVRRLIKIITDRISWLNCFGYQIAGINLLSTQYIVTQLDSGSDTLGVSKVSMRVPRCRDAAGDSRGSQHITTYIHTDYRLHIIKARKKGLLWNGECWIFI